MKMTTILLLDFNSLDGLSNTLRTILESAFASELKLYQKSFDTLEAALANNGLSRLISRLKADMIFLILPAKLFKQASTLLESITKAPSLPIIVVVDANEPDSMFELLKLGAADFITPPLKAIDIVPRVWRLLEQGERAATPVYLLKERLGLKQLIGTSPAFINEIKKFPMVAKCDASVLILGETGTGKELCARAIHYLSPRASKPFVPVNCGAIPVELVENELFGHEREAFTGAATTRFGLIQEADGGTLFLDEIDSLPLLAQVKLLRFLQEKEYRPLGSSKIRNADVRVIAATNNNIEEAVKQRKIRQDLYYRLNIISLVLPPLRERKEDIPLLARHFLAKYADKFNKKVRDFSAQVLKILLSYEWPGNVRQLEHVIAQAIVLCDREIIQNINVCLPYRQAAVPQESFQEMKAKMIAQFEKSYIEEMLITYQGNITKAAQAAQKDRRAFRQLIRKHKIDVQSFKASSQSY
ncbi:MAG: sigma-54 dependent transcriptional regulator [Acidobacteriota bacterium]